MSDRQNDAWRRVVAARGLEARDYAVQLGVPALVGTSQQVFWADSLRARVLEQVAFAEFRDPDHLFSEFAAAELSRLVAKVLAMVFAHTSAAWWIEQRDRLLVVEPSRFFAINLLQLLETDAPIALSEANVLWAASLDGVDCAVVKIATTWFRS